MKFTPNFIVQLPHAVKNDKSLNWTDRVAFFFYSEYDGDDEKVMKELDLSSRQLRKIKLKLSSKDYIARIMKGKKARYVPIDVSTLYFERVKRLIAASTEGFRRISNENLLTLQGKHSIGEIFNTLEVLEWTYRNSNKAKVVNPLNVLAAALKTGVGTPADFVSGFWEQEHQEKLEKQKKDAERSARALREAEKDALRDKSFDKYLESLTPEGRKTLEAEADKSIESNGGWLPFMTPALKRIQTRMQMKEIFESKYTATV